MAPPPAADEGPRVELENDHGGPIDPDEIEDERFAAIFQLLNDMQCGVIVLDRRGVVFGSNERLRNWLGYGGEGPQSLRGRLARDLVAPENRDRFDAGRARVLEGDLRAAITILRRRDGQRPENHHDLRPPTSEPRAPRRLRRRRLRHQRIAHGVEPPAIGGTMLCRCW